MKPISTRFVKGILEAITCEFYKDGSLVSTRVRILNVAEPVGSVMIEFAGRVPREYDKKRVVYTEQTYRLSGSQCISQSIKLDEKNAPIGVPYSVRAERTE